MVLAALAFQPEEFDVGVDLFGVANWMRTLESIPPGGKRSARRSTRRSATRSADARCSRKSRRSSRRQIHKPLMVLQGANDPRVLKAESDDIVAAVKKNGVPVEYIVFPGRGPRLHQEEEPDRGLQRGAEVPRQAPERESEQNGVGPASDRASARLRFDW